MPVEIERKFVARSDCLPEPVSSSEIAQGYIDPELASVRIRMRGDSCYLTLKGAVSGMARSEFEFPIPVEQGQAMLKQLCRKPVIEKIRHLIDHGNHRWEVDVFAGENAGLVVAEVELEAENETVELPDWVSREVTHDRKYSNAALATRPFCEWTEEERSAS